MSDKEDSAKKAAQEAARKAAEEAQKQAARKASEEAERRAAEAQRVKLTEIKNREEHLKKAMPPKDILPPIKPKDGPKTD